MDAIDKVRLMAELSNEHCSLNHGPGIGNDKISAADYVVMPIGYAENDVQDVAVRQLVIPVCFDCALALKGEEWTLLYCFECANSRWVCRKLAKNNFRHHILWLRGCSAACTLPMCRPAAPKPFWLSMRSGWQPDPAVLMD
jgi:hypothetical protein